MKKFKAVLLVPIVLLIIFMLVGNIAAESDITFGWDPSIAEDLSGYNLYQTDDPNIDMVNSDYLVATIGDPNAVEYRLEGVGDGSHFWCMTAFDLSNNESGPSNVVTTDEPLDTTAPNPPGLGIIRIERTVTERTESRTTTTTTTTTTSAP